MHWALSWKQWSPAGHTTQPVMDLKNNIKKNVDYSGASQLAIILDCVRASLSILYLTPVPKKNKKFTGVEIASILQHSLCLTLKQCYFCTIEPLCASHSQRPKKGLVMSLCKVGRIHRHKGEKEKSL